jgi:hypothetical protein
VTPNDSGPDGGLARELAQLRREHPTSPTFTDRVMLDLERRSLVRRVAGRIASPWWAAVAAALLIFATGLGFGAALGGGTPPAGDVNVPRVGQSEVWF